MTVVSSAVLLLLAGVLVLLGRWGRRNAHHAVPWMSPHDRQRRSCTLRRGARTCYFLAIVLALTGLGTLIPP
jgi:hypothetical protein